MLILCVVIQGEACGTELISHLDEKVHRQLYKYVKLASYFY